MAKVWARQLPPPTLPDCYLTLERLVAMGGSCGEELSTLAQGGTARSDSPPSRLNLKPLNFATMQMHILKYTEQETRLDKYNEIRGILKKTTLLITEMKHQTIAPSEYVHIEGTIHSPICLES